LSDWLFLHSRTYRGWSSHRGWLRVSREHDPARNAETQPPVDENIEWRAFWLCEAFLVSHEAALEQALSRLRSAAHGFSFDLDEALRAIRDRPGLPGGSYWRHLGFVKPREKYPHISGFHLPLPEAIDHVRISLYSPFPALHLLVGCFVISDELCDEPTRLLRERYVSMGQRDGSTTQVFDPEMQKARALRRLRYERKRECSNWLKVVVGADGLFSGGALQGDRFPAVEFWSTREAAPLDDEMSRAQRNYMRILGFDRSFDRWTSPGLPGIVMSEAPGDSPSWDRDDPSHSLVLVARERDLYAGVDWDSQHLGPRSHWTELAFLEHDAAALAGSQGLYSVVVASERRLGRVSRDLLNLNLSSPRKAARSFRGLEVDFLRLVRDLMPFATAFNAERDHLPRFFRQQYRGIDFSYDRKPDEPPWYSAIIDNAAQRVELVQLKLSDTATIQGVVSTALATHANLRLQRQVARLTYILVILTLLAVLVGALTAHAEVGKLIHHLL
jgi:hypothetical protein